MALRVWCVPGPLPEFAMQAPRLATTERSLRLIETDLQCRPLTSCALLRLGAGRREAWRCLCALRCLRCRQTTSVVSRLSLGGGTTWQHEEARRHRLHSGTPALPSAPPPSACRRATPQQQQQVPRRHYSRRVTAEEPRTTYTSCQGGFVAQCTPRGRRAVVSSMCTQHIPTARRRRRRHRTCVNRLAR